MDRSRTTSGALGNGLPIGNWILSSSSRSNGTPRRRSTSNSAFSSTRTREQRMPIIGGCVIIQVFVYLCDYTRSGGYSHAGFEEQVTGEDRRDAGEDRQEGRAGVFGRIGLIPLRRPGEREIPGRGAVRDHGGRGPGPGRDGRRHPEGEGAGHHADSDRRKAGVRGPVAVEGDPG